ncbi:Na+/H+ antiporter NhaA [Methylobacterium haplocladii]|uniref:Na(+)/H(+) antiporter NhaA n=1 Tax=Methylobacterium haplocladii TaxID=1176176 RepID=A0A512IL47_9HYPH|nr:Na+/H+ antiporter NhaA [Methylobacterium haplocladii]GEO98440.1 Na(+)/H(+) antiporter NhaA [Methylobacterium haplocladii]GJD83068.1 Na(+)/H(+) antiporter NhaA [Methylobacterium haplocladii]GLS60898.1 Na(+)/H(+) antiporter NhaA [Methylobacterium haplocladii]
MKPPPKAVRALPKRARRPISALRAFLVSEASGGIVLMAAAAAALLIANAPLGDAYARALHAHLGPLSLLHWINDGLMAVFFLLVGLEIKREGLDGRLRTWPDRVLPGVAAAAGMVVPALAYLAFNLGTGTARGWAIPAATDIAFALGVLALLGPRVPISLKIFLSAVAIVDDLGAVVIIALFYTGSLDATMLAGATAVLVALFVLNRSGVRALWPYLALGLVLWVLVLRSGVHATVAGVLLALFIPIRPTPGKPEDAASPLHRLEHGLHPWVAFLIVPVFGFANAGVRLVGLPADALVAPVTLGVALGLFVGKQVGVLLSVRLAVALGIAQKPAGANWGQVYGVALLCGIGFTMSLFIGGLAFGDGLYETETKLGVLVGSLLSGIAGAVVLKLATPRAAHEKGAR